MSPGSSGLGISIIWYYGMMMNNEYHPRQILALVPPALLQWDGSPEYLSSAEFRTEEARQSKNYS